MMGRDWQGIHALGAKRAGRGLRYLVTAMYCGLGSFRTVGGRAFPSERAPKH